MGTIRMVSVGAFSRLQENPSRIIFTPTMVRRVKVDYVSVTGDDPHHGYPGNPADDCHSTLENPKTEGNNRSGIDKPEI